MMRRFAIVFILAACVGWAPTRAQQNLLVIQPSQVAGITATTTTRNAVALAATGMQSTVDILINITAGGTATGTMQLYLQESADGGVTWDDLVSSNTFAFGAAAVTQRFFIGGDLIPSTIATATSTNITQGSAAVTETMAAGTARQGPFGDRLRVREKVSGPSGSPVGPTYTITAVFK